MKSKIKCRIEIQEFENGKARYRAKGSSEDILRCFVGLAFALVRDGILTVRTMDRVAKVLEHKRHVAPPGITVH